MPELRYRDNPIIGSINQMGGDFANTAIALQRLRMTQQQQQLENYFRNIEMGLKQKNVESEVADRQANTEMTKELFKNAAAVRQGVFNLNAPKVPGGVGPPNPIDVEMQNVKAALAYIAATSPGTAQRMLEPQQFGPNQNVYDPLMNLGGSRQPLFTTPPAAESEYQRQMMVQRKNEMARRIHQAIMNENFKRQQLKQGEERLGIEREKVDKATDKSDPYGLKARMRAKLSGTNAPASRFKVISEE